MQKQISKYILQLKQKSKHKNKHKGKGEISKCKISWIVMLKKTRNSYSNRSSKKAWKKQRFMRIPDVLPQRNTKAASEGPAFPLAVF